MKTIEYGQWSPGTSPLRVEFPRKLFLELQGAETFGILHGSRRGNQIRIVGLGAPSGPALMTPSGEDSEQVGVFVARIRGEVFLTEADLLYFKEHEGSGVQVALVVAGERAGFFIREADGSIQTVSSHEEFPIAPEETAPPLAIAVGRDPRAPRLWGKHMWQLAHGWKGVGLSLLAALPIAALAMIPQGMVSQGVVSQGVEKTPLALEVHEIDGQLRITWEPGRNAVVGIVDGAIRLATPVYSNQSSLTYSPQSPQVEVSLVMMDAANRQRSASAVFISSKADRSSLPADSPESRPAKRGRP